MPDIPDGPGKDLATLIRDARQAKGMTQEQLEAASGVSRQTIIAYESGRAVSPRGDYVRPVLLALDVDPREGAVALGIVTREEAGLPAERIQLDPVLADVHRMVTDKKIPKAKRDNLLMGVRAALDVWIDGNRIKAPTEAAASARHRRTAPSR